MENETIETIQKWIKGGVPVDRAKFSDAVDNADQVPETHFSDGSDNASRRVKMWWTSQGLICLQKNKYFVVPTGTIKFAHFK